MKKRRKLRDPFWRFRRALSRRVIRDRKKEASRRACRRP